MSCVYIYIDIDRWSVSGIDIDLSMVDEGCVCIKIWMVCLVEGCVTV